MTLLERISSLLEGRSFGSISKAVGGFHDLVGWGAVLSITGTCTYQLLATYTPRQFPWMPWLGLAVFEYGLVRWMHYHTRVARNAPQYLVGFVMAAVSIIAISLSTLSELLLWFGVSLPLDMHGTVSVAIPIIIISNVIAFSACKLLSPENIGQFETHNSNPLSGTVPVNTQASPNTNGRYRGYSAAPKP